ncbi:MAG: plasmid mobilization relaxosome protein MobC, partial [Flavobacterium sp.]
LLQNGFEKSLCRKLSDYARKNLLGKPVVLKYRNQSVDDLVLEISRLRTELNAIGNIYNQAVKKLHSLRQISEFQTWIFTFQDDKNRLFESIETIKISMLKLIEKWLP